MCVGGQIIYYTHLTHSRNDRATLPNNRQSPARAQPRVGRGAARRDADDFGPREPRHAASTLQTDLIVCYLEDEDDAAVVASTLLTIERMAAHQPAELSEYNGLIGPLINMLDHRAPNVRHHAARCVATFCEDEHGLASARLIDGGLIASISRLASAERQHQRFTTALIAVKVLARLSQESRFARRIVDGGVRGVLLFLCAAAASVAAE